MPVSQERRLDFRAFWDNRAALHLAPRDSQHVTGDRILHRITLVGDVPVGVDGRKLAGDVPVGPDGRPSAAAEGEPFLGA
jgi:hypothetical protein